VIEGLYGKIDAFAPEEAGLWIVRVIKAHGVPLRMRTKLLFPARWGDSVAHEHGLMQR
jgi:hypothetical protein